MRTKICKAYIVYDSNGDEIALLKAKSMQDAEDEVVAYTNERAFNFCIEATEVAEKKVKFGWHKELSQEQINFGWFGDLS